MRVLFFLVGLFFSLTVLASNPQREFYLVKKWIHAGKTEILSIEKSERTLPPWSHQLQLRSTPKHLSEDSAKTNGFYEEWIYDTSEFKNQKLALKQNFVPEDEADSLSEEQLAQSELRTLVDQGNPKNRIDLTILGDGYTNEEKEKFFADAKRITDDMFQGKTFASYLPLFNVYAIFVPSRDSGITDLTSKNTAFGLYRDPKGSKRAIIPGKENAARRALTLAPDTDYPIILANDDFYGGLGGEFAISTRSVRSGTIVLRHELGHNFGDVGEEYDSGYVYRGANFYPDKDVSWGQWLTDSSIAEAHYLNGEYLWKNLARDATSFEFYFPKASSHGDFRFYGLLSSVGWSTPDDVYVFVDGERVSIEGEYTNDRSFFTVELNRSLAPGRHTISFQENVHDGDNVLAFATLYALGSGYKTDRHVYGAYPTFTAPGDMVGYRPTHDTCLMRNMKSTDFCKVDKENMWLRFLSRVDLIDEVKTVSSSAASSMIEVKTPALDGLEIQWFKLDSAGIKEELVPLKNQARVTLDKGSNYEVRVHFSTPEIRLSSDRLTMTRSLSL